MDHGRGDLGQKRDVAACHRERLQDFFHLAQSLRSRGAAQRLGDEGVLFDVNPSLGFAPRQVHDLQPLGSPGLPAYRMTVNVFGLYGVNSPLPGHYAEDVLRAGEDAPLRRFLDIFNHRLLTLYHDAWLRHRHYLSPVPGGQQMMRWRLLAVAGSGGVDSAAVPAELDAASLQTVAGLLSGRRLSRLGLQRLLRSYFGLPQVRVEENIRKRLPISAGQRSRLGKIGTRLAADFTVGGSVRDQRTMFRIVFSELSLAAYRRFLPVAADRLALRRLLRLALHKPLRWELRLELAVGQRPPFMLGANRGLRLGLDTWLGPGGGLAWRQDELG